MTFLPILERELRLRARSRANYWGRFAVAGLAVLVCAPPLLRSGLFVTPSANGRGAFDGLIIAAFLLCCAACLLTTDMISGERREGTLGLLLLTHVTHFDLLLGKFASSGLASLLGLVAFLPVLVLPLLTGGVTGGEVARKAAALLDTLFLALSVGLWASARGFERFRTARTAVLVLTGLVLGPSMLGLFLPFTGVGMASPLGTFSQAADLAYKASHARYWLSLGLVQLIGWLLLSGAMVSLRARAGAGEDDTNHGSTPARGNTPALRPTLTSETPQAPDLTPSAITCRYCGRENQPKAIYCRGCGTELLPKPPPKKSRASTLLAARSPLYWLLGRQCGLKPMLWLAAAIGFSHFAVFGMAGRFFSRGPGISFVGLSWGFGLVATAVTGALFAWVASRFFVETRRTGELELLLTTPLGAEQIVTTQWNVLQRLLRFPLAVMLVPLAFQGMLLFSGGYRQPDFWKLYYVISLALSGANTLLNVCALCWVGLWFGLRVAGQGRVILWTVLLVRGIPYVLGIVWSLLYQPIVSRLLAPGTSWWGSTWLLGSLVPQLVTLLFSLWLIRLARWQLLHELAGAEPLTVPEILVRLLPRMVAAVRRARQWPGV